MTHVLGARAGIHDPQGRLQETGAGLALVDGPTGAIEHAPIENAARVLDVRFIEGEEGRTGGSLGQR